MPERRGSLRDTQWLLWLFGNLDPDGGLSRDGSHDADAGRPEGQSEIVGEACHLADLDSRRRLEFVHGDHRTGQNFHHLALHSKSASFTSSRRAFVSRLSFWISTGLSVGCFVEKIQGREFEVSCTFMKGKASCSGFFDGSRLGLHDRHLSLGFDLFLFDVLLADFPLSFLLGLLHGELSEPFHDAVSPKENAGEEPSERSVGEDHEGNDEDRSQR